MPEMITIAEFAGQRNYKVLAQLIDDDNQVVENKTIDVYTRMKDDDFRWKGFIFSAAVGAFDVQIGWAVKVVEVEETTEW